MARFKDKVFLISGGARGMGEMQARRLVADGGKVVIGDVLLDAGLKLAAELGSACSFVPMDVTAESQWQDGIAAARRHGALVGLVNNAGIYRPTPMLQESAESFEQHTRINQLGTFLGMKAVAPELAAAGGGSIVNISSTAGLRASLNAIAYTGTKWAVRGMTKTAALELADKNIRVNSVHPGAINTDMLPFSDDDTTQRRLSRIPLKRYGTADEIAGLVLFLLSDEARYMTGAELTMDGGLSL